LTISENIIAVLKKQKTDQAAKRLKLGLVKDGGKWEGSEEAKNDFIFTS
jgi:hypothetical protein